MTKKPKTFKNESHEIVATLHNSDVLQFLRALDDDSIDLIITDPAYSGMNQHLALGKGRIVGNYSEDRTEKWFAEFHDTPENYQAFLSECKRVLKQDRHIFIMFDSYSMISLGPIFREVFNLKNVLTWDKVSIGMGHYFRRRTEFILFGSKGKRPVTRRDIPDIWRIKRIHSAAYPTQKPVELFEAMIASSWDQQDEFKVCDPFLGSGSAAIAAIKLGANFVGNDISEKSLATSTERLNHFLKKGEDSLQAKSALVEGGLSKFWNDRQANIEN